MENLARIGNFCFDSNCTAQIGNSVTCVTVARQITGCVKVLQKIQTFAYCLILSIFTQKQKLAYL